ncbi:MULTISPECIES: TetR/AcrR family transcriptional regulator [Methylococcus]|uniref:TetR/AcrR family transcriptional regulator n=1 Tax=Methylococcus capsulatus TaxID=414 RepID=A0ABZ2F7Z2_METCP|nr:MULTISPECIES: TetR/AcrR family transcriptional regulator [Methylococcus]MDF9391033.1 TetR family transcriptional regulator [Methylococcus capsulatus]
MTKTATKQLTRERLLNEGVALLMEQGYHGTGLQDILQRVGVPKGSFYNYFASKEEFGAEVIRHYIEPFLLRLDGHLRDSSRNSAQSLQAYFRELIEEAGRRRFKGGCLLGNLMGEIGDTSDTCREALGEALHRHRDKLAQGIARAQDEGVFRRDRSAEELADCLVDAWQGALLRMKIERSTRPLEECCRNLLEGYFQP